MVARPRPDARHLSFISAVLRLDHLCQTLSFRREAPGAFRPSRSIVAKAEPFRKPLPRQPSQTHGFSPFWSGRFGRSAIE